MIFDTLKNIENYKGLGKVYTALRFLADTDFSEYELGRYSLEGDDIYFMVQSYTTDPNKSLAEGHEEYIDIQYIISGREIIAVAPIEGEKTLVEEKPGKDTKLYKCNTQPMVLIDGCFMVLYPSDLHMPGVADIEPCNCRKVVVKVRKSQLDGEVCREKYGF